MKCTITKLLSTALLAATISVCANTAPPSLAIFDFESKEESVKDLGAKVATLLNAHLSADPNLILVERAELEKALGEQELGLSGTVSTESAAKVGHLTGAKVLVTGRVFKVDRDLMLVAKVIGTETSRVYGEVSKGSASGSLDDLVSELARKISATVAAKTDTLIAKVPTREDRVDAIKKLLKVTKLPIISVRIPEQHFGGQVVDPAAQTELAMILQQAGFQLVDEKSSQKPDIEITGEAFSAFGVRRGNLISCKARVELKAQNREDGTIVKVDRETSVVVDITEQTAAKTALQNAAAELASRMATKLAGGSATDTK
ncbi:MAG: curli assembly protein CsgG [Verrucomicrobia bacterium]|nr:curli assembly protein CsgG [Verrucomicrobiota bacterium]